MYDLGSAIYITCSPAYSLALLLCCTWFKAQKLTDCMQELNYGGHIRVHPNHQSLGHPDSMGK